MSAVNTIKSRLAELARTVSGIKRAYVTAPQSLPPGDLPVAIPFTGPVTAFQSLGESLAEETRVYFLRVYITPIQQGYDGEAEKAVEPYLTRVRDTFLAHPALGLGTANTSLAFVERLSWQGDNGVAVLPFAGENYLGAEFRFTVTVIVPITLASYE